MIDYKKKYLKYKNKYLQINSKTYGGNSNIININDFCNVLIESKQLISFHNNNLFELMIPSNKLLENTHIFSKQIKNLNNVSNQKNSGRCWLFAALNVIRHKFINKYNLKSDFEFSENYLFFYDKLERVNYVLNLLEKFNKNNIPLTNRVLQHILQAPLDDGGLWNMFVNLINKYGLVPKSVYPETKHSSSSGNINHMLNKIILSSFKNIQNNTFNKKSVLNDVYILLIQCFGKPPSIFDWEYVDKKDKYNIKKDCNPIDFYKNINIKIEDYIVLINDPRNTYNMNYSVEHLNNMEEGLPVKYLNLEIEQLKEITYNSINNNEPVFFGCDVDKFLLHKNNLLDTEIYNYETLLNLKLDLTKKERLMYYSTVPNHAMVITGYNKLNNIINRWQIENSWGTNRHKNTDEENVYNGYYTMTDKWFDEYVFMIVVNKKYANSSIKKKFVSPIDFTLPLYDPFGTLA